MFIGVAFLLLILQVAFPETPKHPVKARKKKGIDNRYRVKYGSITTRQSCKKIHSGFEWNIEKETFETYIRNKNASRNDDETSTKRQRNADDETERRR
jgi:hypothetical protein